jgi:hypothetical protein
VNGTSNYRRLGLRRQPVAAEHALGGLSCQENDYPLLSLCTGILEVGAILVKTKLLSVKSIADMLEI